MVCGHRPRGFGAVLARWLQSVKNGGRLPAPASAGAAVRDNRSNAPGDLRVARSLPRFALDRLLGGQPFRLGAVDQPDDRGATLQRIDDGAAGV